MTPADFFHSLYSSIRNKNPFLQKIRFYSMLRVVVRVSANILLPVFFKLTPTPTLNKSAKDAPIVSITTFPKRIGRLWIVIESLMRQTVKPKLIILWLSRDQFQSLESVPRSLRKMQKKGLKIEFRDGDIRSHKKYFYAFTELKNEIIITADDDIIYPSYTIEKLMLVHGKSPNSVCARFVVTIGYNPDGTLMKLREPGMLFFCSGGGVLFPPNSVDERMLNISDAQAMCPIADDVWLNAMVNMKPTKILKTDEYFSLLPVINLRNETLSSINLGRSQNEVQIENTRRFCVEKFGRNPFLA